ncbi:adenylyl-sulfate kinase [Conexibacter sp. DBS9H8]|uniref:adenylyl-sulfate kinase n=1 Tax=Conexibacter sp. DBS9H8 TaxID=2937801 RepID=UPI00200CAC80|nr:adenylyl-sulfate kinase [Conexibacter sp. DBS9H8]
MSGRWPTGPLGGPDRPVVWFTGLSGAGKSTLSASLGRALEARGEPTVILDGDRIRTGLCADLGFSDGDRRENIRRVAETARLMRDAGLTVLVALISPFRDERARARAIIGAEAFVEVHVHAPLAIAEARDPKGLYARARRGELRQFTGIDSPYEPPVTPDVRIDTSQVSPAEATAAILDHLDHRGRGPDGSR